MIHVKCYLFIMLYLAYLVTSKLGWMQANVCTHNWYWIDVCWKIPFLKKKSNNHNLNIMKFQNNFKKNIKSSYFVKISQWFGLSILWGRYYMDLSRIYDFKFGIFALFFEKMHLYFITCQKMCCFNFIFFKTFLIFILTITKKKKRFWNRDMGSYVFVAMGTM